MQVKEIQHVSFSRYMTYGISVSMVLTVLVRIANTSTHGPHYHIAYNFFVVIAPLIFLVLMAVPVYLFKLYRPKEEDDERKSVRRRAAQKLHGFSAGVIANGVLWQYILEQFLIGAMK